jgi:hypothetical protein
VHAVLIASKGIDAVEVVLERARVVAHVEEEELAVEGAGGVQADAAVGLVRIR